MSTEESAINAGEFLSSMRGRWIMSQALFLAMKEINSRPEIEQEPSNVADMKLLFDNLFPLYREFSVEHFEQLKMALVDKENSEEVVDQSSALD